MRDILARVRYLRKPLLELRTSEVRPRAVLGTSGYGVLRTSGVGVRGFGAPAADRFARLPPPQLWLRCSLASRSDRRPQMRASPLSPHAGCCWSREWPVCPAARANLAPPLWGQ